MFLFSAIFNFFQKTVKRLSNALCQARLDSVLSASMHGMAYAFNGALTDEIGNSIKNSLGR